jgi:hypothetical protein
MNVDILTEAYAKKMAAKGLSWIIEQIILELEEAKTYAKSGDIDAMMCCINEVYTSVEAMSDAYELAKDKGV